MSSVLSAAVLAHCARDSLADAARLIRAAQLHKQGRSYSRRPAQRAAELLAEARAIIVSARKLYAHAMGLLAKRGQLTHHYAEWTFGRFRALVRIDGKAAIWLSPRTYGKRQSAQRAAARYVEKLRTSAACAGAMA